MTATLNDVVIAIGTMSAEDLNQVIEAVKYRRERIAQTAKRAFRIGDHVEWDGKYGGVDSGKIISIGPKNVKILHDTTNVRWTVHPNLLRKK